jgi:CHAT domain-containing protein
MHKEVLAIRESGGPSVAMVETLTELGRIYLGLGKLDDAFGYLKRAQDIADRTSDPGARARATIFMAAYYDAREEWDEALRLYDTARGLVERMRLVIDEGEARQAFLAWRQAPYLGVAAAHASLGRPVEALVAVEGARARTLLDLIDDEGGRAWLASTTDTQTAIRQVLPEGTAAMEFVVESERVWTYLVKSTADGLQVQVVKLAHTPADVTTLATRFADGVATRDLGFASAGQALYTALLAPHEAWLADVKHLVLVPDGVLWRVPFQALRPAGGSFLIERMAVSYAPSLAARAALQARAAGRPVKPAGTLLALGDPQLAAEFSRPALPQARREVRAIAGLYGATRGRVFVGDEATSEALRSHAPNASVLHIATHGVLEDAAPMSSHVLLAGSESRFEARDWLDLKLNADLVVLSACQTARGALGGGEGIVGLAWGVFASGASSAIVSQWEVDSASTTSLMIALHKQLIAQQDSVLAPADALRSAARSMLADARYRHPFYWAGFVAIGR